MNVNHNIVRNQLIIYWNRLVLDNILTLKLLLGIAIDITRCCEHGVIKSIYSLSPGLSVSKGVRIIIKNIFTVQYIFSACYS